MLYRVAAERGLPADINLQDIVIPLFALKFDQETICLALGST